MQIEQISGIKLLTGNIVCYWPGQLNIIKCQRIPMGQSKKDNPERLATQGTQDKEKQKNTICVGHHYAQKHTNNINKT